MSPRDWTPDLESNNAVCISGYIAWNGRIILMGNEF
jgi:hypothetical protein